MLPPNEIEKEYALLLNVKDKPIREGAVVQARLKWQKAINDLSMAKCAFQVSTSGKIKRALDCPNETTFFDWAIIAAYYSMFHAAQALLGMKKVKINRRVHHATLIAFARHFIINNELAAELFLIYENAEEKANELLAVYEEEMEKRGLFQYHRLSRDNVVPAEESIKNAAIFLNAIQEVLKKNNII
ncbi:MAG: hypothetical protein QME12_03745 [Nanoarchaeota archaeon]|nr:hypothetical protein [Nanoarchaeota archaeon]